MHWWCTQASTYYFRSLFLFPTFFMHISHPLSKQSVLLQLLASKWLQSDFFLYLTHLLLTPVFWHFIPVYHSLGILFFSTLLQSDHAVVVNVKAECSFALLQVAASSEGWHWVICLLHSWVFSVELTVQTQWNLSLQCKFSFSFTKVSVFTALPT